MIHVVPFFSSWTSQHGACPKKIHCNIQGTDQGRVECLFVAPAVAALSPFPVIVPNPRPRADYSPEPPPKPPAPIALGALVRPVIFSFGRVVVAAANPRSASSSPSSLLLHSPPDQTRGASHAPWRTTCLRVLAHGLPLLVLFDVAYHPGSPLTRPS